MRDPKRITELMELINQLWLRDPDLRFNQLMYNLQCGYSHVNGGQGKIVQTEPDGNERIGHDLFNLEDDAFIEYLRSV